MIKTTEIGLDLSEVEMAKTKTLENIIDEQLDNASELIQFDTELIERLGKENAELKAEVERLKESLKIEKEVSEGALFANRMNFNITEASDVKNLYRKKPVEIEAIQYNGNNGGQLQSWSNNIVIQSPVLEPTEDNPTGCYLQIKTLKGTMIAIVNDWVIKGIKGEFYPCKPDIFEAIYYKVYQKAN